MIFIAQETMFSSGEAEVETEEGGEDSKRR